MKYLLTKNHAMSLASIAEINVSCNYLLLTAIAEGREIRFVYGSEGDLTRLFHAIMDFIKSDEVVFDCDKFLGRK